MSTLNLNWASESKPHTIRAWAVSIMHGYKASCMVALKRWKYDHEHLHETSHETLCCSCEARVQLIIGVRSRLLSRAAIAAVTAASQLTFWVPVYMHGWSVVIRDGRYDTTIIDTTDTDTSSCSIDTWLLATPIRYLAHVMYFIVPGNVEHQCRQRGCFPRLVKW